MRLIGLPDCFLSLLSFELVSLFLRSVCTQIYQTVSELIRRQQERAAKSEVPHGPRWFPLPNHGPVSFDSSR